MSYRRYQHRFTHHHTHTIWDITTQLNCRVMLGGEIYYRAIGRPWGPAVNFIITVKFHPGRSAALTVAVQSAGPLTGGPGSSGSSWSHLRIQV
jgi:hypothetical protein